MIDAGQVVANDARVVSAVLDDEVLDPEGPLRYHNRTDGPLRLLVVLQPSDVGSGIPDTRATKPEHISRRFDDRAVHLVGLVEHRRTRWCGLIVITGISVLGFVVLQIRIEVKRPHLRKICQKIREKGLKNDN